MMIKEKSWGGYLEKGVVIQVKVDSPIAQLVRALH